MKRPGGRLIEGRELFSSWGRRSYDTYRYQPSPCHASLNTNHSHTAMTIRFDLIKQPISMRQAEQTVRSARSFCYFCLVSRAAGWPNQWFNKLEPDTQRCACNRHVFCHFLLCCDPEANSVIVTRNWLLIEVSLRGAAS